MAKSNFWVRVLLALNLLAGLLYARPGNRMAAVAAGPDPDPCGISRTAKAGAALPTGPAPLPGGQNPDPTAYPPGDALPALNDRLKALADTARANGLDQAGLMIVDGLSGQALQYNPDQVFGTASLYKVFVLWKVQLEIRTGQLQEDSLIPLAAYPDDEGEGAETGDKNRPGLPDKGSSSDPEPEPDPTPEPEPPEPHPVISVSEARYRMITYSDNAAAWSLAETVGWFEIERMLDEHGYRATHVNTPEPVTTAREIARFFQELANHSLDPALSPGDYDLMLELFKAQRINSLISPGLPSGAVFAHKTGSLGNYLHDAGIVFAPGGRFYIIVALTQGQYQAELELMRELARLSWNTPGIRPFPVYYPQTGKTLSGKFLEYWVKQGGLAGFGYPLTESGLERNQATGKIYLVQWFERARFEYHPENSGTPYEVLLGLLGNELCARAPAANPAFQPARPLKSPPAPGPLVYFSPTGHNLGPAFLDYWQKNGGLARFGYPISEEHPEVSPENGKQYLVQWFERARFEYHPEYAGTPYQVLLGHLGRESMVLKQATGLP